MVSKFPAFKNPAIRPTSPSVTLPTQLISLHLITRIILEKSSQSVNHYSISMFCCYFLYFKSKYNTYHLIHKYPTSNCSPWVKRNIENYTNNRPMRRNTKQSIYYSASSLYMFWVPTTPTNRSTQYCNCSLRYWSHFLCAATSLRGQLCQQLLSGQRAFDNHLPVYTALFISFNWDI